MCGTCGCGATRRLLSSLPKPEGNGQTRHISLELNLLQKNDGIAQQNRRYFLENQLLAINILSSPGAGKTTLLEHTAAHFQRHHQPIYVLEGDQHTDRDAQRVRQAGAIAQQINTGHLCHLEAFHIAQALPLLAAQPQRYLFIENVGNLVCPAHFDLGEKLRMVLISVTEGDDKPLKYPDILLDADLLLISKADLLPYVDFDVDKCLSYALQINPRLRSLTLSTKQPETLAAWFSWLATQRARCLQAPEPRISDGASLSAGAPAEDASSERR